MTAANSRLAAMPFAGRRGLHENLSHDPLWIFTKFDPDCYRDGTAASRGR